MGVSGYNIGQVVRYECFYLYITDKECIRGQWVYKLEGSGFDKLDKSWIKSSEISPHDFRNVDEMRRRNKIIFRENRLKKLLDK
ncbi:MAG: hypothetical protein SLAVMIC_00014 [uncultured marine phage]|uniref:Uncharacterized protein n=1 Tax=uncultured marine phage TaxID=707152 RepID=A0A8D9C995_9VIRU|nr:MAG: hypothetical protein SLAVMIC_00014 [uncultured marine phage]